MKTTYALLLFISHFFILNAQPYEKNKADIYFTEAHITNEIRQLLHNQFTNFTVVHIDSSSLTQITDEHKRTILLHLPDGNILQLFIEKNNLYNGNSKCTELTDEGEIDIPLYSTPTYKGTDNSGNAVRLTITDKNISGYVYHNKKRLFIQPLHELVSTTDNTFILYYAEDVIGTSGKKCLAKETYASTMPGEDMTGSLMSSDDCVELKIFLAADYSMYEKYEYSSSVLSDHLATVLNLSEGNFVDFNVDFIIEEEYFITCPGCDPWSDTVSMGTYIDAFGAWATPYSAGQDEGQLWTDHAFTGIIGTAYYPGICTDYKFSAVSENSLVLDEMRLVCSHELGHNFNAGHDDDSTYYIMAPSPWNSSEQTEFSPISQLEINGYLDDISCLSHCPGFPDIVATIDSISSPCILSSGALTIYYNLYNVGSFNISDAFTNKLYLDGVETGVGNVPLGFTNTFSLDGGEFFFDLPEYAIPAGTVAAEYFVVLISDSGEDIDEYTGDNNIDTFGIVIIQDTCSTTLSEFSAFFDADGGSAEFFITIPDECIWNITSVPDWVTISSATEGSESAFIYYSVEENTTCSARTDTLYVNGEMYIISQSGPVYELSQDGYIFTHTGGEQNVHVIAPSDLCAWYAYTTDDWVTFTAPGPNYGSMNFIYNVSENTGAYRTTSLSLAGLSYLVEQEEGAVVLHALLQNEIHVYPNPATHDLILEFNDLPPFTVAEIQDVSGHQIFFTSISDRYTKIDVQKFSEGVYVLKIKNQNSSLAFSFLKL